MIANSYINQLCSRCGNENDQLRVQTKKPVCRNCQKEKQRLYTKARKKRIKGGNRLWKKLSPTEKSR